MGVCHARSPEQTKKIFSLDHRELLARRYYMKWSQIYNYPVDLIRPLSVLFCLSVCLSFCPITIFVPTIFLCLISHLSFFLKPHTLYWMKKWGGGQFFFNPTVLRLSSSPACCSCFHQHKKSKYRGRFRICLSVFPKLFPILLVFLFECSTWLCFFEGGGGWTRERKGKRGFNIQQKYIAPYMRALHR